METVERSTVVALPAPEMWERATSIAGISDELRPWLAMTMPHRLEGVTLAELPLGEPLGRSWVLLGGVLPVEYDDLCLIELEPGRRFRERSSMLTMEVWGHERIVEPLDERSCRVTDRLELELRRPLAAIPGAAMLARRIVGAVFDHRHRRLARLGGRFA